MVVPLVLALYSQGQGGVIKSESQLARKGEAMMHKTSNAIYKYVP